MRWWLATSHDGGEMVRVCGRDDDERPSGYPEGEWSLVELEREPGEFDRVGADGSIMFDAAAARAAFGRAVDAAAGVARARFVTILPGQDMTYLRKELEARDYAAGGSGPWPIMAATAAATGEALADIAAAIIAKAESWLATGARIEAARIAAKARIGLAEDLESMADAAAVDWRAVADGGQ